MKRERQRIIAIVFLLLLMVTETVAQGVAITLKCSNMPLPTALYQVEKQSGYFKVSYNYGLLRSYKVNADIRKLSAEEAVKILVKGLPLKVETEGRIIRVNNAPLQRQDVSRSVVSGQLLDQEGNPLVGATVKEVGANNGVVTDADGRYVLENVSAESTIEYSYVGMKTFRRKASFKPLRIMMENDENTLNDVVVTGYQTLKRENATGAFQAVSSQKLEDRYTTTLTANLEGRVAGLVNSDGDGGSIRIRGISTLKASSSPLVVVDGLPISGGLGDVNPYEVERITVLKDASATAIYGARASNGVIVIETKKATQEKLTIDFNAAITTRSKAHYDDTDICSAAEQIELAQNNFQWMIQRKNVFESMLNQYEKRGKTMSPITRLMIQHYKGEVSDADYNSTIAQWGQNDYRKEWQDLVLQNQVKQRYNLAMRTKGRYLNSSIVVDWQSDNTLRKGQYDNTLSLQYVGSMDVTKWLNMDFGVTFNNNRSRTHTTGNYDRSGMTDFYAYESMYNADGTPARLQAYVALDEPSLSDKSLGLKDEGYVPVDEVNLNFTKSRETYSRSYIHVNVFPIPELKLSGMFQYEDVSGRSEKLVEGDSYSMRHVYNLFTSGGKHYMPEGGLMDQSNNEGNYYTVRGQASYNKVFAEKHAVSAIAGYEYRETYSRSMQSRLYGYDEQTLSNNTGLVNFKDLTTLKSTDLGKNYSPEYVFIASEVANATHVKHRYESIYGTANYTFDHRYAVSVSYRVDKADLFGADPKFRNRPLWSVGGSWNANNERFMKDIKWIDMLKLRFSYGVTGNINTNYSSYLTANIYTNSVHGDKYASLNTPPNDQLRWEKTQTWNAGVDFSVLDHRLTGSLDVYRKKGTDVLATIDLDPTTGWQSLNTNNAETLNKGVELQLGADILRARSDRQLGISADLTLAYNNNKITRIHHQPTSGWSALEAYHEGDPINSLYSFAFDHVGQDENGFQQVYWRKANGEVACSDLYGTSFTVDDVVFSGSMDPKWAGSFAPKFTYRGFSLCGVFVFYAGHYFRADAQRWSTTTGYTYSASANRSLLDYWRASESDRATMLGNGSMMKDMQVSSYDLQYIDQNVDHADYMKLRNLVLGYRLPMSVCRSIGLQAVGLRFQVNNVLTWVRNARGIDPERVDAMTGALSGRIPRTYTFNLNVKF